MVIIIESGQHVEYQNGECQNEEYQNEEYQNKEYQNRKFDKSSTYLETMQYKFRIMSSK